MKQHSQYLIFGLGLLIVIGLFFLRQKKSAPQNISQQQETKDIFPSEAKSKSTERRESASEPVTPSPPVTGPADSSAPPPLQSSELYATSTWKIVPQTSAVPQAQMPDDENQKQVSGFVLVKTGSASSQERQFQVGRPLVYFNTRTSSYGVLTGTLRLKLKSNDALSEVLQAYGLRVADSFAHLKTYMVVSEVSPFDLISLTEKLRQDADVQEAEPELLTRKFEKN